MMKQQADDNTAEDLFKKAFGEKKARYHKIDANDIEFYADSSAMCRANACGRYKKTYSCPPAAPDAAALFSKVKEYKNAYLFSLEYDMKDAFDWQSAESALCEFNKLCRSIKTNAALLGLDAMVLGAGACDYCESCAYPDGPCRRPDKLIYPLEAAGIDANSLQKAAGSKFFNTAPKFIGLLLY